MITSFFAPANKNGSKRNRVDNGDDTNNSSANTPNEAPDSKRPKPTSEVEELLQYLNDGDEEEELSWKKALSNFTSGTKFASLAKFVANERSSKTIYPPPEDTFSALNLTPLKSVKVVIVGQDPYHNPNQGHGLAFSVQKHIAIPPSLKNIYKQLSNDPQTSFQTPSHGHLERWARQGVLLLNAVLTVEKNKPFSHKKRGWEEFTDTIINTLNKQQKGLVFLLWGKPASKKAEKFIDKKKHTVICTSHPSPLGAAKTNSPFLGSCCFGRANEALRKQGLEEIDWNVDGDL